MRAPWRWKYRLGVPQGHYRSRFKVEGQPFFQALRQTAYSLVYLKFYSKI